MGSDPQPLTDPRSYVWGLTMSKQGPARSPAHPPLPAVFQQHFSAEQWNHLAELHLRLAPDRTIVLTPVDATEAAKIEYILLEPLAPVVVAVSYEDKDASVWAHAPLWESHQEPLTSLLAGTRARAQSGLVFEALEFAITAAGALGHLDDEL